MTLNMIVLRVNNNKAITSKFARSGRWLRMIFLTCIYCPDILRTYQRETRLFGFSRNTNRKELKIKLRHFAIVSLCNGRTLLCYGYVALEIAFCKQSRTMFPKKATIFFHDALYTEKYRPVGKDFHANENAALAVQNFR